MAPLFLFLFLLLLLSTTHILLLPTSATSLPLNSTSSPELVVRELQSQLRHSRSRLLQQTSSGGCLTGNPIDDCWRCSGTDWSLDRRRLAGCSVGFGRDAHGGRDGQTYVVTDSSDRDAVNPAPGTLRYGVIQDVPLWITFASSMSIKLSQELLVNSFKTIDGRGADVHIAGGACLTLQYVSNVIIHNLNIHHCVPTGNANVRSSPTHYGYRTIADGDGISIYSATDIWIDHCSLSYCSDGLIDAIMGSTRITISNSYFSHHNEVMLLGHNDNHLPDSGMQVTIAFNHFGEALVQRMPRCRRGYIHVVNNDYTQWEMYAIGGSASPTINSQGNRYIAPSDPNSKEVTKRVDTAEGQWAGWNWRTEGDLMVNGAFFVPSGEGLEAKYSKAESLEAKTAAMIDQLTMNAGVFGGSRSSGGGGGSGGGSGATFNYGGSTSGGDGGSSGGGGNGYFGGMVFGSSASRTISHSIPLSSLSSVVALLWLTLLHLRPL